MRKKIAILGSTGSIGRQTLDIIRKNNKFFEISLITANKNFSLLCKQIKEFNVKNIIVTDINCFNKLKKKFKNLNIYNDLNKINKIVKCKLDYSMCCISGLEGLPPTLDIIKKTKIIAIANKESLICGWNLINKELIKHQTKFIPIDSEHFSIWQLIKNKNINNIQKIYITASGGPFLNYPLKNFKKITFKEAINHPNWNMGNKISIDSSTLMNKVFEVIEASNIFHIDLKKFEIVVHPKSYVHSIINYKSGYSEMLFHNPDMKIPILNSLDFENINLLNIKDKPDFKLLNNLNFQNVNFHKFPSTKILKLIPKQITLFNTVLVASNDSLVNLFINKKIKFNDISKYLYKIINLKKYRYTKSKKPKNIREINDLMFDVFKSARDICND